MIRVYNYMAAGVALTGVVAWLTFNAAVVTDAAGRITALTPFGQTIFSGPLADRAVPGHAWLGVFYELPHQLAAAMHGADTVHGLCRRCSG